MIDINHPEAFCQLCGRGNVVWNAPDDIWNRATNGATHKILCPRCFMKWYEIEIGRDVVWTIQPSRPVHEVSCDCPDLAIPCRYGTHSKPATT